MNDYYFDKFNRLIKLEYSKKESIAEIYNIFLDNKPNIPDRNRVFWGSQLFIDFPEEMIEEELFALAFGQRLQGGIVEDVELIERIALKESCALVKAVKYSKIFLDDENINFKQIKKIFLEKNISRDFLQACEILRLRFQNLKNDVKAYDAVLMRYGYLDLLCFMSIYMMKYAQENLDPVGLYSNHSILTLILQKRLTSGDVKKRAIDEHYIADKFSKNFSIDLKNYSKSNFEEICEKYKKLNSFEENELSTFCFDDNFSYKICADILEINVVDINLHKRWYQNGEKILELFKFYKERAYVYSEELLKNEMFGLLENDGINKFAYLNTCETYFLMQEQYGLDDDIKIDEDSTIPLFQSLYSINGLRGLYQKYFLESYLRYFDQSKNWINAWQNLCRESIVTKKNRLPLISRKIGEFSEKMRLEDDKQMDAYKIEHFWTMDLRELNKKQEKIPSVCEKPLMKIDNHVFIMPFSIGYQHSSESFINSLLRVLPARKDKKNEVKRSESYLAEQFIRIGFNAKASYVLPLSGDYDVGDVDVICEKDGCLFVLELKSTYIRASFEGVWKYKTQQLRKATNQLRKREFLISKLIKDQNDKFISEFGNPRKIFFWIVDTSFEFDHEIFSNYLKISLLELLYVLQDAYSDVESFVEAIEKVKFWNHLKLEDMRQEDVNCKIYN